MKMNAAGLLEPLRAFSMRNLAYVAGGGVIVSPWVVGRWQDVDLLLGFAGKYGAITSVGLCVLLIFALFFLGLIACELVRMGAILFRWLYFFEDLPKEGSKRAWADKWIGLPVNHVNAPGSHAHFSALCARLKKTEAEALERIVSLMHLGTAMFAGGLFGLLVWFLVWRLSGNTNHAVWISLLILILWGYAESRLKRHVVQSLAKKMADNLPAQDSPRG